MCERMRCLCNNLQMRSRSPPMALFRHPRPPSSLAYYPRM
jgi:hypothetical protein